MNGPYQPDGLIPFGQNVPPPVDPSLQGSPGNAAQGPQATGGYSQPGGIGGTGPIAAPPPAAAAPPPPAVAPTLGAAPPPQALAVAPALTAHPGAILAGPFSVTGSPHSPVPIPRPPAVPGFGRGNGGGGAQAQAPSPMTAQALQQLLQRYPQLAQHLQALGARPGFGLIGAGVPQSGRSVPLPLANAMQPGGPGGAGPIAAPGYPAAGAYAPQL